MEDQAKPDAGLLQQRIAHWVQEFGVSPQHAVLTSAQKRGCARIIDQFVHAMWQQHGRLPEKWSAKSVEQCCLTSMPQQGGVTPAMLLAMPPVLVAFVDFLQEREVIRNGTVLIRAVHRVQERLLRSGDARHGKSGRGQESEAGLPEALEGDPLEGLRRMAAQIAREMARQRPALISRAAMENLEQQPLLVFDIFQLIVEEFLIEQRPDDFRISACFMLLAHALRNIRFGMERHFEWAVELDREFQSMVVKRAEEESLPPQLLAGVVESLADARLAPSPGLLEAYEERIVQYTQRDELPTRGQIDAMFETLVDEHGGDPFAIGETLSQMTRALPFDAQSALIGEFAASSLPGMKDAVVILCLHSEENVRLEALHWLQHHAKQVTPSALRRLIVIRNWLPELERKRLDVLIKSARTKGVECAQWPEGMVIQGVRSSRLDGVGAASLLISMPVKPGKARIGGLLLKQGVGIADAWITPLITRHEAASTFRQVMQQEFFLEVSQEYLYTAIRHHLAVGLASGQPPAVGLLQLAELVVATTWIPERLDGRQLVERVIGSERPKADDAGVVEQIVQASDAGIDLSRITSSWFEESQEVVDFMENTRIRSRERLTRQVLERFCEPKREVWAERCAWTAFWLREQSVKARSMEELDFHFAILARELYRGRPLHELPLMRRIAERTMVGGVV
ncbi:MAG: hypothetical protein G8237_03705 [Magnetococcales bacterium]|nr:hypothetical protein [Magnetococcales bacterium]